MAEEKKPGTGDTAPGKAAARKKTRSTAGRAKASVKKKFRNRIQRLRQQIKQNPRQKR